MTDPRQHINYTMPTTVQYVETASTTAGVIVACVVAAALVLGPMFLGYMAGYEMGMAVATKEGQH